MVDEAQESILGERARRLSETAAAKDAPPEPQMTGFVPVPAARAAKGRRTLDPTEATMALTWGNIKRRAFGREERTLAAIKAIRDLDPQASTAVWSLIRLINPGHDVVAYVGEGLEETPEEGEAQAFLDDLASRTFAEYGGGTDQGSNVLALSLITNGAVCLEVVPTEDLGDVEDWYPVDPPLIAFRRDPATLKLQIGQRYKDGSFVALNPELVFYYPVDSDVDDPYGRPPLLAAVASVMAKAQVLNDIRAAAHHAGYPRIDVKVLREAVQAAAPTTLQAPGREKDLAGWMDSELGKIVTSYESLQVDDTFVHYDFVEVSYLHANAPTFDFDKLETILERQLNQALKTLPIMVGVLDSTTESHGSVQWQIQAETIKTLRKLVKRILERAANVSLELAGFQAHAKVEYEELRTVDRLYEAQAELFETKTLEEHVRMGWRDNDEAAEIMTDHPAVAEPLSGAFAPPPPPAPSSETSGNQGQEPTSTEKASPPKPASDHAWELLKSSATWAPPPRRPLDRGAIFREDIEEVEDKYGRLAGDIYDDYGEILVELLRGEGIVKDAAWTNEQRAVATDIADGVFGLGYRREMKRLLRDAIREGMLKAGVTDPSVSESLVRRIWSDNTAFIDRIRNDLSSAITEGEFTNLADVTEWLKANRYREELMGKFLAKQGYNAGWADARQDARPEAKFTWQLGAVVTDHCPDCYERANGGPYTYGELLAMGFPGDVSLQCGAGCKCFVGEF